jgi:hypothetical protein
MSSGPVKLVSSPSPPGAYIKQQETLNKIVQTILHFSEAAELIFHHIVEIL